MNAEDRFATFHRGMNARVDRRECSPGDRLDTMNVIPGAGAYTALFETD